MTASANGKSRKEIAMAGSGRSYRWVWFFSLLGILGVAAVVINGLYSRSQLLTPEKLAAAVQQWQEKGPSNYRLQYTKNIAVGNSKSTNTYILWVRNGQTLAVLEKLKPDDPDDTGRLLESRLNPSYGMDAMLDDIQTFLDRKEPAYTKAIFDPEDGHLTYFVRSVSIDDKTQRVTYQDVKLQPQQASDPLPEFLTLEQK